MSTPRIPRIRRVSLILAGTIISAVGIYGLKTAAGINLIKDTSLGHYFPFTLFVPSSTIYQGIDIRGLEEDFESPFPLPNRWINVHSPRRDLVTKEYSRNCPGDSRCMTIKNTGSQRWHVTHRYRFVVRPDERVAVSALLWSASAGGYAQVQISAYDTQGERIAYDVWHIGSAQQRTYEQIRKDFTIHQGVGSIGVRIAGEGPGEFRFDNLKLERLN